jgi:hypothetical protein
MPEIRGYVRTRGVARGKPWSCGSSREQQQQQLLQQQQQARVNLVTKTHVPGELG